MSEMMVIAPAGKAVDALNQQILEENVLLRGVINLAIVRLDGITGEPGQDIEAMLVTIREELEAVLE